jgi:PadR family transcriptional regulator, regulatory protein PadR
MELLQGTLDMLILKIISREAMHGYAIVRRIQQVSNDLLKIEEGSLYPSLYRMEKRGWIESEWGVSATNRRAKYYKITRAGSKQLEIEASDWEQMAEIISRIMQMA